ncbi:hypothetical protein JTE90_017263 [Oedothorax gibbosus]|uniref:Uncharacterized protein n=1 Tax=Oedothorax gibbosus TaxID=931172 RepID=A0AAV6VDP1_9ARAC|nr:hypothetical protein JTE90_017263 [Oedothorax gibbosus]
MNWNDNFGDTSIDEVFNFNTHAQGNKKKRSSILKQTKKADIEMFENEETDYRRNRQSMKRVSFAETFQVKEIQTGNIYDIPGFNESSQRSSHSVQISHLTESVTNNSEGTFPSRSFVPEPSNIIFKDPTETFINTNMPPLKDKAQQNIDLCERSIPLLPVVPDKKSSRQTKTIQALYKAGKSVVALLEGTPIVEDKENIYLPQEPSQLPWMGSDYLKGNSNTDDNLDFLKESCFKGSQESHNNSENYGILPFGSSNTKSSQKTDRNLKVDVLNKENILQTSPKFNTLKFIDSPPSWKSVDENILRNPHTVSTAKEVENQPMGKVLFVSKNKGPNVKGKALMRNSQRGMGIYSEIDKENVLPGMKMTTKPPSFSVPDPISVPSGNGNDNPEFNHTRCNVSAMDLTLLPDNFGQDDTSIEPENIPISNERTHNKTRLTMCDMEMTCAFDQSVSEEASVSSPKLDVLVRTQCKNSLKISDASKYTGNKTTKNKTRFSNYDMEMTCAFDQSVSSPKLDVLIGTQCNNSLKLSDTSIRSSQQSNAPIDLEEDFPLSRHTGNERAQNKTRFSNYDMEMTCAFDQSDVGDSMSVSSQISDKFIIPEVPNKTNKIHPKETIFDKSLRNSQDSNPASRMLPETLNHIADDNFKFGQDLPLGRCVNEKTQNKTRFSTCNMEITCAFDQSVVEDFSSENLDVSTESELDDVFKKDHIKAFKAMESSESLRSSQESNPRNQTLLDFSKNVADVDLQGDSPITRCADVEKKQNKTRFSMCDMDITCAFNQSVVENFASVSPPRTNKLGDFGKSNLDRNTEENILKVFEATNLDKSLKSSQQSNFSFEEMDQLPSSDFINVGDTKPASDVGKSCNTQTSLKIFESFQFENKNNCFEGNSRYKVQDKDMSNRLEENNEPKIGALGRKYLKFYSDSEAGNFNDRLQTSSPAKDLDSSFTLKNKENLPLNRKRIAHSSNKPPRMPLGFQNKGMEVDSLSGTCSKSFNKAADISKASLLEDVLEPSSKPEIPSVGQRTLLFRSEVMELTCHNLSFEENADFSNSIVEQVQVVNETEISSPGDMFSDGKFKNTRYSTNYMDLTCLPESHDSSEVLDISQKADTSKLDSPKEVHQVPPYFHLKEFSMTHSNQTNSMNQNVRARRKMFKIITDDFSSSKPSSLTTTQESVHNSYFMDKDMSISAYPSKDALVKNCQSSAVVSSDSCFQVDDFQESTKEMPCHRVVKQNFSSINSEGIKNPSTPGIVYTIRKIKQTLKEGNGNLFLFPDLSEALKKKQKFSFKHPYTEMKISSPIVKDCRQNQSFEPESQENSFTCLSGEGSRHPSSVGLSFHHKANSEGRVDLRNTEVKSLCRNIENFSVLVSSPENPQPKINLSIISPEMKHSRAMSNLNCSDALSDTVNEPVFHSVASPGTQQSLSVPKDNYSMVSPEKLREQINHSVSYAQVPCTTFDDDSFQLLHHSALENSLMDSYSKKFTICLDKSDFVPKESVPVSPPKMDRRAFASNSMIENESMFRLSPKIVREDSIALPIADEPTMSRKIPCVFPETYKNTSTNQTHLDISHKFEKNSNSSLRDIPETSKDNYDFAARLKANALILSNLIKSSSVSNSEGSNSTERFKLSKNEEPAESDTTSLSQLPSQDENEFTDTENTVNILEENRVTNSKSTTELSHAHENSNMVLEEELIGEENKHLDEDVAMSDAEEPKDSQLNIGESSSICRVPVLGDSLSIFKEKFEEAFACERRNWTLKNLSKEAATFELQWCVYEYSCVLRVEVAHLNASECSISFIPIGKSMVVGNMDNYLLRLIQERGYQYFEYLVKDKVLPFSIYSPEMIVKFTEYAQIVNDVEALMRDLMKLELSGICDHSSDLEPVSVTIQGINDHYEHVYDMTFRVDLKTYPRAKIVPEVKHKISSRLYKNDIMNEILAACASLEPGKDYLYRMLDAARDLRPPL